MSDLFERHPLPWTIADGIVFDHRGKVVDLSQAKVRAELVEAVNALGPSRGGRAPV
jgi:hypothetical protein